MTDNKDDDLIRRGDALNVLRPYGSLIDVIDRIAALPAVTPQPAPDVAALVEALRKCVAMLDALVKESGRGVDWGEEDPFRMGEWFEDQDLANIEAARAALAAWEGRAMSDDYRLREDLQRIIANAGAAPHWNTASDKPVVPDRYTRAEVAAAVKRAIDACADEIDCGGCYGQCQDPANCHAKEASAIRALATDPAALERIIEGERK